MNATFQDPSHFLLPGEWYFAQEACRIDTLLGSCVALCLRDREHGWGGMNHYMVPEPTGTLAPGKVGSLVNQSLIDAAFAAGCKRHNLEAFLVGGAAVHGHLGASQTLSSFDIGQRNIECAERVLFHNGIRFESTSTGGQLGRRLSFYPATGRLDIREIAATSDRLARSQRNAALQQRRARILLVDDSATVRAVLRHLVGSTPDLEVCGEAEDPYQARELILSKHPDVLCLDVIMPRLDGLSFLRKIMRYRPIPTIIVSTIAQAGGAMAQKLYDAGAVAVLDKTQLALHHQLAHASAILLPALRQAAALPMAGTHP